MKVIKNLVLLITLIFFVLTTFSFAQKTSASLNITVKDQLKNGFHVSWFKSSEALVKAKVQVTKYTVYKNGKELTSIDTSKNKKTTYDDRDVKKGQTYEYKVVATTKDGSSIESNSVKITKK